MPAILIEGGYMDSLIDIKKLRDTKVLQAVGYAVADAVVEYFGIKPKEELTMKQYDELKKLIEEQNKIIKQQANEISALKKNKQDKPSDSQTPDPSHAENWKRAKEAGLLNGQNPHHPITREQVATVLVRGLNK